MVIRINGSSAITSLLTTALSNTPGKFGANRVGINNSAINNINSILARNARISSLPQDASATTILSRALSSTTPGKFQPKTSAFSNLQATLAQQETDANNRLILNSAINRLKGIQQGTIQPNEDREWEVVGAYLQATGQPFQLKISDKGQLSVEAQADSKLEDYNDVQKGRIANAIELFADVAAQVDQQSTRNRYLASYDYAAARMLQMREHAPAEEPWEIDFQRYAALGRPVQVGLNVDGELVAIDQLEHDFSEVENVDDQLKLLAARDKLANILRNPGLATEEWHLLALGYKASGEDYLLVLDDDGEVTVRNNLHREKTSSILPDYLQDPADFRLSLNHIIPDFLKEDVEIETTAKWQEDAANLYRQGKPFYFDFDNTGLNIVTRELTLNHALNLHKPVDRTQAIIRAQVSILT